MGVSRVTGVSLLHGSLEPLQSSRVLFFSLNQWVAVVYLSGLCCFPASDRITSHCAHLSGMTFVSKMSYLSGSFLTSTGLLDTLPHWQPLDFCGIRLLSSRTQISYEGRWLFFSWFLIQSASILVHWASILFVGCLEAQGLRQLHRDRELERAPSLKEDTGFELPPLPVKATSWSLFPVGAQ